MSNSTVPEFHMSAALCPRPRMYSGMFGYQVFGKRIRSLVYTTDVAIIRNCTQTR